MPLFQAIAVGVLALVGVVLTQSWTTRRDYAKRRIEFAEEVLAQFYEVNDAFRSIRAPFTWLGEGKSRTRGEHEDEIMAESLDRAYVVVERFIRHKSTFSNLRSKKFRYMAMFRGNAHEPFDDIEMALNQILIASDMLGKYYWKNQGLLDMNSEQSQRSHKEGKKMEATIWSGIDGDAIAALVDKAIKKIESVTDKAAKRYV